MGTNKHQMHFMVPATSRVHNTQSHPVLCNSQQSSHTPKQDKSAAQTCNIMTRHGKPCWNSAMVTVCLFCSPNFSVNLFPRR